jgi:hypothetical protein
MPTALAEAKQRLAFNFDHSAPSTAFAKRADQITSAIGTFETCRATLTMSVPRVNPEVAFRGRRDRC